MSHQLQRSAVARLQKADDVFPHDREFLQAFLQQTSRELWEVLEKISEGDADRAAAEAGYLAYMVQSTDIGKGGGLPIWYDMKPSEYQRAKADAVRRLRAVEHELAALVPGIEQVSMFAVLWPDGPRDLRRIGEETPAKTRDGSMLGSVMERQGLDDVALRFWGGRAGLALSELSDFFERSYPEHCPTIAGQNGAIEAICREVEQFEPRRYNKPKSGPAWPRHFVCQLFEQLNEDSGFSDLSQADKYRLIDGCLDFYAGWIGREDDADSWDVRRIEDSVTR